MSDIGCECMWVGFPVCLAGQAGDTVGMANGRWATQREISAGKSFKNVAAVSYQLPAARFPPPPTWHIIPATVSKPNKRTHSHTN